MNMWKTLMLCIAMGMIGCGPKMAPVTEDDRSGDEVKKAHTQHAQDAKNPQTSKDDKLKSAHGGR